MIRKNIRRRLTVFFLLAVIGLLGSYVLLRGASKTSMVEEKPAAKTEPALAPAPNSTARMTVPKKSVPQHKIPKALKQENREILDPSTAKFIPTRVSKSSAVADASPANRKSAHAGVESASFASAAVEPSFRKAAPASKLSAAALPPASSAPPNAPTANSPADGGSSVSTSPTLSVNVSDPNSSNLTVNFYGKVVPSAAAGQSFSIVALPDTQYYSAGLQGGTLAMFSSQTQWIVNHIVSNNIAFVTGLGDIVQDGNNNGNYSEWVNANSAISLLDDPVTTGLPQGIPYSFGVGNHDQGPAGDGSPDDTAAFNQYFGVSRYANKPSYGGHYGTNNDNHYVLFSAGGMDFILINIAYMDPAFDGAELNSVLAWANGLLQTYSTRRGIVVSHYLLNSGFNATWSSQGQATYNALSGNPNLFLMLAGHLTPPEGQRADVNNGNRVYTFLSDYQESGSGGDGWLRIYTFVPSSNQIQVQTYSPYINQSETTSSGKFTINYDMHGNGNNFTLLTSKTGVLSGTSTSFTWPSLAAGSTYEWYATVSNSTGTTIGPLWSFTTTGTSPVSLSPSSLSFPSQPLNTTSASQAVTLLNTSSSSLSISSIAASTRFGQTNNCPISPSTLAVNATCTINVTFTPTASGTQSGNITITDSAVGSPQQISLTGTGATTVAPAVNLSPSSLTFGTSAVAVVQDAGIIGSGSSTLALKFGSNVTKNNLIVVGVSSYAGNAFASPAITDTLGSPWSLAIYKNPGTSGTPALAAIYYAVAPSSGTDTITVHMTGTNNLHLHIYEVSGLVTSSVLDQTGSNFQSSGTAGTVSTAGATTMPNEFVFAFFARDNGVGTWTAGSGYGNALASPNAGSKTDAFSEDKIISATGTQIATATSSASDGLTSLIATFVAAGGGTTAGTTSAAQTMTLTNTGSASLSISSIVASGDYGQTNTCGSFIAAGVNCPISITFTPTAIGTRNGAITLTDNAANSPQVGNLTGTGMAVVGPGASLSPAILSFGNQTINTSSAAQTITLNSIGTVSLTITSIAASAQYSQTNTCGASVAAGGNCTISVKFTPTATGSQPGTITITDNATGSPQIVNLTGSGTAANAPAVGLAPPSLSFSSQTLNTPSAAQTVTLTNSGSASLSITSIVASTQYSQTNTCGASVVAGAKCTISVTFTPTATGTQAGTITITDNATGSPQIVNLTGSGVTVSAVSLAPTSLSFGSQTLNTPSAAQSVTLTNSGSASLSITSIVASTQYSQTNTCGASVAAGAKCTISVTFTPTAAGLQSGTITITDNAAGSPHVISLAGQGPPTITTISLPNGTQNSAYSTTLAASGGTAPYTWSVSVGTLPAGLGLAPSTGVISGTPTGTGTISFTVQVKDANSATATMLLSITVSASSGGGIGLVQENAVQGTRVGSVSVTFPAANTAGNLILAFVRMSSSSQTVKLADSAGNTYALAVGQVQNADGSQVYLYYAKNISGAAGNTVTATFSSTNSHPWLAIFEYNGLNTTNPLDQTAHAQGKSNSPSSGATATTTGANELVFAAMGLPSSYTGTQTVGSGYTFLEQDTAGSAAATESELSTSTGAFTATFTLGSNANWAAIVATFKP